MLSILGFRMGYWQLFELMFVVGEFKPRMPRRQGSQAAQTATGGESCRQISLFLRYVGPKRPWKIASMTFPIKLDGNGSCASSFEHTAGSSMVHNVETIFGKTLDPCARLTQDEPGVPRRVVVSNSLFWTTDCNSSPVPRCQA